jgi:hypothetical protein
MPDLVVEIWHRGCGACGYGIGGWLESPAERGKPILAPDSRVCPGCGARSTRVIDVCAGTVTLLPVSEAA